MTSIGLKYHVVSTCHEAGWKLYGRRMVKTLLFYWPTKIIDFTLYAEGFKPDMPLADVRTLPTWIDDFKRRHKTTPSHNGLIDGKPYNLLFDAVRFCHKVGAVIDRAESATADMLIWVDADTVTHSPIKPSFLEEISPVNNVLAWLNRAHKYPECGFYIINLRHPVTAALLASWKRMYAADLLFELEHWTDCHSLEAAVNRTGAPWQSLSGGFENVGHPFINGPLGAVMDHLKGDRKRTGKSRRLDLKLKRAEDYWRGLKR